MGKRLIMAYSGKVKDLRRVLGDALWEEASEDPERVIHMPSNRCPGCGASLFGQYIELVAHYTGRHTGGCCAYHCRRCGKSWRMFVPRMTRRNVSLWALQLRGYFGGCDA